MKIIAHNHTHWDREWYRTFEEFRMRFPEVIDAIIAKIKTGHIDCFYLDGQTVVLEDYFEIYPENKSLLQDLIKQNKIITGPWYALADEFLVSGESLFRNMLIGTYMAREFGGNNFIGYLPDLFGHNSEMPRILRAFGIENAVLWRGAGNKKSEFLWDSPDGSSVLVTYLLEGYYWEVLWEMLQDNIPAEEKPARLKKFLDKIKDRSASEYILCPVGADHIEPLWGMKEIIEEFGDKIENYSFETGGILEYIEKINNIFGENNNLLTGVTGELRDNSRNPILAGVFSARLYLKQANTHATEKLFKLAEPFYSFLKNEKLVTPKNNEIKHAAKLLIKNHTHDSICGCSIDEVHNEMMIRFDGVERICDYLISKGRNAVSSRVKQNEVWVYNSSDYSYSGTVKVKTSEEPQTKFKQLIDSFRYFPEDVLLDTEKIPFPEDMKDFGEYLLYAENIPPHSIKIIDGNFSKLPDKIEIGENFIKNSRIKVEIMPDGNLKFTDFELNKEFDGLHEFCDRADTGDTYNFAPLKDDIPIKAKFIKTEILEKDDLRSILRVHYEIEVPENFDEETGMRSKNIVKSEIITDISITANSKTAEFVTDFENKAKDRLLQIKFGFNENIKEIVAENTFGVIKRECDVDYCLNDYIPAEEGKELKTNIAPMQRFVFINGLGVLTEGLPEYETEKNNLYITVLRAVGILSKAAPNTRNLAAGPPLATPGAQCLGKNSVRYAICAAEKPEDLFKEVDIFYGNIITGVGKNDITENYFSDGNLHEFIKIGNPDIYTYAAKSPETGEGVVIRLLNLSGKEQKVLLRSDSGFTDYAEVNGLEENIAESKSFAEEIIFTPYELKSILLKRV